ncbi:putative 50S ribosomal subunit protein L29 [Candidatus Tremblaya princeps]|uniref:Putative 50S ribosomal subunit protein L29 n=1 Tax=Tremblaya princeps TaxID=189385 RepID=A0A143WNU2_TREPR|nr:putative 50S ribosomal subunit protein L29 [Candidatus Tremblaya princeps]
MSKASTLTGRLCARFMAAELGMLMLRRASEDARLAVQRSGHGAVFPRAGVMAARAAHALIDLEGLGYG